MPDTRDLCLVQDVKNAFEPTVTGSGRDARIQELITDASIAIMRELDRELTPQTAGVTRRFRLDPGGDDRGVLVDLAPYDLRSATTIVLHPEEPSPTMLVANKDYALEPINAPQGVYLRLRLSNLTVVTSDYWARFGYALMDITGNWGIWNTTGVDADVKEACVLTVRAWMRQNPAAYLVNQGGQQGGGPVQTAVPQTFEIPNAVKRKLKTFYRDGVGGC